MKHEPGCRELSRRSVIRTAGLAGLGLTASAIPAWSLPAAWFAAGEEIVPFTDIPEEFSTKSGTGPETYPGEKTFRMDLRELKSWTTPTLEFFTVGHYGIPKVDTAAWKLSATGLVGQPMTLGLDDIKRRPRVERTLTFECSGNQAGIIHGMVGNAAWGGTSLRGLLQDLAPAAAAKEVIFWAADSGEETIRNNKYVQSFGRSLSLDEAMKADAILAWEMNGQPLSVVHGAPLRLVVPGYYGICNVKWLTGIELSDTRLMNRFMGRDYVTIKGRQVGDHVEWLETSVTKMHVKSVVARVTRTTGTDRFKVFGAAWSDGTPLKSVEVQLDEGPWQPAKLEPQSNPYAWTFWTLDTTGLSAGDHTVVSRATDTTGREQPVSLELKKTYWEDNAQFRRKIKV